MIVAAHEALAHIQDDDLILIDGERGEVVVHPTAQDLARYRNWQRDVVQRGKRLALLRDVDDAHARRRRRSSCTPTPNSPADIAQARAFGAAGVGLYRTEFLFLQRKELPGEEEQFLAYRDLVLGMGGLPVTIRTLDLGADKADATGLVLRRRGQSRARRARRAPVAAPAAAVDIQLRAILRASSYGPVRMLVPMVTDRRGNGRRARICSTSARATCVPPGTRSPSTSSSAR